MNRQSAIHHHQRSWVDRIRERVHSYLLNHAHGLFSSLGRLSRNPFTSVMTIMVLAISISLAGGFYIVVKNLRQMTGNLESSHQMSLFLRDNVTEAAGMKLADQLRSHPSSESVKYISKKQAMEEFKLNSGFAEALSALDQNPLPSVIQVQPKNVLETDEEIHHLMTEFKQLPQVDFVQVDMQWVDRMQTLMVLISRAVYLVSLLLGVAVLFISGNTIRLELHSRRDEVYISKLVGATQSFIQRPFLYSGFWLGFLAAIVGWIIVGLMLLLVENPVEKLSTLYNSDFELQYLGFTETLTLLTLSSGLAMVGAFGVLQYQLRQLKPE